jgi:fructose-specific component phosphotransferase system IIB-like protein
VEVGQVTKFLLEIMVAAAAHRAWARTVRETPEVMAALACQVQ